MWLRGRWWLRLVCTLLSLSLSRKLKLKSRVTCYIGVVSKHAPDSDRVLTRPKPKNKANKGS
jgi:hypothetical protein